MRRVLISLVAAVSVLAAGQLVASETASAASPAAKPWWCVIAPTAPGC